MSDAVMKPMADSVTGRGIFSACQEILAASTPVGGWEEPDEQDVLDTISDAIGDSMDLDWTYSTGAKAIVEAFKREGWTLSAPPPPSVSIDKGSRPQEAVPTERADKPVVVYIDCEFDGHDGPLLSIALVKNDDDSIHIRADVEPMDLWVRQNVLTVMDAHQAPQSATVYHNEVGGVIRAFLGECAAPVIVADSPVDIGRFCRALSTGADGGWASADYPRMTFEVHNVDCYPTDLVGAVQHNAWWDAMALRSVLTTTGNSVGTAKPCTKRDQPA